MSLGQRPALLADHERNTLHVQVEGKKTVPLEVQKDVIHDRRGILSMGRHSDPDSGGSSFSILLGPAPHLDQQYTIFG